MVACSIDGSAVNGVDHQYKPSSMHKLTRVITSKGPNTTGEGVPTLRRKNSQSAISSVVDAALRTIAPKDLFFLDSTNLHSVQDLEALVNRSANYLLFLTAEVLQRPAVLVEICAAHVARKNIIPVSRFPWRAWRRNGRAPVHLPAPPGAGH